MFCEACGFVGPRFERIVPPTPGDVVTIVALVSFVCVIGLAIALHTIFTSWRQLSCPRCGATDSLWPAPEQAGLPIDPAWLAAKSGNDAALRRRRRTGMFVVGVAAALGALFLVAISGWVRKAG
jgi:hypothetical protein